jgi:hypothetical protein
VALSLPAFSIRLADDFDVDVSARCRNGQSARKIAEETREDSLASIGAQGKGCQPGSDLVSCKVVFKNQDNLARNKI